ncbi:MAG: S1C family serine protease [Cyanobacteriota bacterium]
MDALNPLVGFSKALADVVQQASPAVVSIFGRHHFPSSGIHWQSDIVLTAQHTLEREEDIPVRLANGQTPTARVIGRDPGSDLAVLKLEVSSGGAGGQAFSPLPVANLDNLSVGSLAIALARLGEKGVSASVGVVGSLLEGWPTRRGPRIERVIRPDIRLYPGFSGGPLLDPLGHWIGMNTSRLGRRLDFTLPADVIQRAASQLLEKGRISRGYLGVGMQSVRLPEALQNSLNLSTVAGVILISLETGGPAEQAGLLIGDVLVALEGVPVTDTYEVLALLGPERIGHTVQVQVIRAGALVEVSLVVGERPWGEA